MSGDTAPIPIRFVFQYSRGRSNKNDALSDQENRAHSARVVHARRRLRVDTKSTSTRRTRKDYETQRRRASTENTTSTGGRVIPTTTPVSESPDSALLQSLMVRLKPDRLLGNSDPFSYFPIKIIPQINQTLAFMRDVYFPTIYDNNKLITLVYRGSALPSMGHRAWSFSFETLHTEGAGLACIASYLGTMSILMPELGRRNATQLSLALSTKSSILFRNALAHLPFPSDASVSKGLVVQVYFLHRASMIRGDRVSTSLYGNILNGLIIKSVSEGPVDYLMLLQAAIDDIDASAKFMCYPSLDYHWFGQTCLSLWNQVEPALPTVPQEVYTCLHGNVECDKLRQAFLDFRRMNAYAEKPMSPSVWETSPTPWQSVFSWFTTKSTWAIGIATTLFLTLRDARSSNHDPPVGQRLTQAALALGLVYRFRSVLGTTINSIDVRDCSASIMLHLGHVMVKVFAFCTDQELQEYVDAHLWILFTGAFWEQQTSRTRSGEPCWFQEQLVERALVAKKATWAKLKPILERFAYSDWEKPNGSAWFDDIAQEHELRYFSTWTPAQEPPRINVITD